MDKKSVLIVAVVIGVVGIMAGMVWSAEQDKRKDVETNQDLAMAKSAKITIDEAIKTALENFSGKVVEAELEMKQGKAVWEIEIMTADQGIMEVHVDAASGSVIRTEEKMAGKKS